MADELVRTFCTLPTGIRLDCLDKLLRVLSSPEREHVSSVISQKNDPLSVLPLELSLQVFENLSLLNTWTLRRVCTRWKNVLSSEDFVRASIVRWQTEDPSDDVRERAENGSLQSRVQHMQAMRLNLQLSQITIDNTGTGLQGPQPKLSHRRLDFKGRRIAYISSQQGQGDAVVVRDLITGEEAKLRGEARERILLVVLTTQLVAFVTFEGCLYVWQLHTALADVSRVQLPSSQIRAAGGDGHIVALAMSSAQSNVPYVGSVNVYNAENGHLRSVVVEHPLGGNREGYRALHSCSVLVDSGLQIADIFSLLSGIESPMRSEQPKFLQIDRQRISLSGMMIGANFHRIPIDFQTPLRENQFLMAPPCPTGRRKQYRINICEVPFMGGLPFRLKFSVLFDSTSPNGFQDEDVGSMMKQMDVLWKDRSHRLDVLKDWFEYMFYINNNFLVSLEVSKLYTQQSRIRVLCFDPDVQMADAEDTGNLQYLSDNFAAV